MNGPLPWRLRHPAAAIVLMLMAGCGAHQPKDRILAVVNDQTLTWRDFSADVAAANLPKNVNIRAIEPVLLNELITRKLLVQEAKHEGLDKSPDYLSRVHRAQEVVLAQKLVSNWISQAAAPTPQEAKVFVDANPLMFSDRTVYVLDVITTQSSGIAIEAFASLHSVDAVLSYLSRLNHPFRRGSASLDTLTLSGRTARQIAALPRGEIFIANRNGTLVISAVVRSSPAPVPPNGRIRLAMQILKRASISRVISEQMAKLRSDAKITYPPGFATSESGNTP